MPVHPAAVSDTLLRWARPIGWSTAKEPKDPAAIAGFLRAACALWRASPNDEVQARQLDQVHALVKVLRSLSRLDKVGACEHWGPADPLAALGSGRWGAKFAWSAKNELFGEEPRAHGGTAVATAAAGHALLDAYELLVAAGDLDGSAPLRTAVESAGEWLATDCGYFVHPLGGVVFRAVPGAQHEVYHASACAAGFLARAAAALGRDEWLALAESTLPPLAAAMVEHGGAMAVAKEHAVVDSEFSAAALEGLAILHRASGSAVAELAVRRGLSFLRSKLSASTAGTDDAPPATRMLTVMDGGTTTAGAHGLGIIAAIAAYHQCEDAEGDEALAYARSLASFLTEGGDGGEPMRRGDPAVFHGAAGDSPKPASAWEQAACAYGFALLAELPADAASRASSGGGGSGGGTLTSMLASILEPGVSGTTHIVMQVSLAMTLLVLGLMIAFIDYEVFGIHLYIMAFLGVGLFASYFVFMSAMAEAEEEEEAAKAAAEAEEAGKKEE